ncbi:hypothetical protein RE628_25445 [Paenibacillus sp. D2_2]|uniref:hypothetical protein n=1 Tax=Paenibacillus sp. D2_2 TaxID=3073092 RepID=UPI002814E29F|nr:hypothetical protein [Paenibacillus sp. D2_2]WMT40496.1 hypothetical protein RE628_25445 [Paenibacillus sp. D2_2]
MVIAYDRRCMNHVYVKTDKGKGMIKCDLLSKSSRFMNLSLEEVKSIRYEEKLARDLYKTPELNEEVALNTKLEMIAKKAIDRSEENEDSSLTKAERKANLRGNKTNERDKLRKAQAYDLGKGNDVGEYDVVNNVAPIEVYKPKSKLGLLAKLKNEGVQDHG